MAARRGAHHVEGEYLTVQDASTDQPALRLAHETGCTREEAISLVRRIEKREGLPPGAIRIMFRAGSRGRGGFLYRRGRTWNDSPQRILRVLLPSEPLPDGGYSPYGRLRIGIVLHEVAHAVLVAQGLGYGHGRLFVQRLDQYVQHWLEEATAP